MARIKIAYKTELNPTPEQAQKIRRSIGICRFLYNKYVQLNRKAYQQQASNPTEKNAEIPQWFMTADEFSKSFTQQMQTKYAWMTKCSPELWQVSIANAEMAFKRFFKHRGDFPRFKQKYKDSIKLDFTKKNIEAWQIAGDYIYVPELKEIKIKEVGYLPVDARAARGVISYAAGRYYVSIVVEEEKRQDAYEPVGGMGIYIDAQAFIVYDDGYCETDIEKSRNTEVLRRKIYRETNSLKRRQLQQNNQDNSDYLAHNLIKQKEKLARLYTRLDFIRNDHINKIIAHIVAHKPKYITLGDLTIKQQLAQMADGAGKRQLINWNLPEFKSKLITKCRQLSIEVRQANDVQAEHRLTQICSHCGFMQNTIDNTQVFTCNNCGAALTKCQNAAINLKNLTQYRVL